MMNGNMLSQKKAVDLYDVLIFLIPIMGLFQINIVGQLYYHEILLLALIYPLGVNNLARIMTPSTVGILFFAGIWLFGQIVTDFVVDTPFEDYSRGWAKIIFFIISFVSLRMLLISDGRIIIWMAASAIPIFVRPFESFDFAAEPGILWKFGIGQAILMIMCTPYYIKIKNSPRNFAPYIKIVLVHMIIGVISFFMNARSLAGTTIFSGLLVLIIITYNRKKIKIGDMFFMLIISVLLANTLAFVYSWGASSGVFGSDALLKYNMQNTGGSDSGSVINILLGGRSESMVAIQAIEDSPIIGHGSWAKNYQYSLILQDMKRVFSEDGGPIAYDMLSELIPTHSYLFGAWVEAGVFGGIFWIAIILWLIFYVFPASIERGDVLGVVIVVSITIFIWNILFSPFGANVRVEVAAILAVCCQVVDFAKRKQ